ncbi:type II secretion system GspH family protein [Fibrobacterales bacterium]|nr:type II secretion system GspH family protein [Fibrobacterales bacterium]
MSQKGFSLVELLVTIAIIGILSSLAIVSFADSARQEKVRASGEVIKEFLRNTQLMSHKEGKKLGLQFTSDSLVLYADSACAGTEILDRSVLTNNTKIAANASASAIAEITTPPTSAGWAGSWAGHTSECLKIDPGSEGSVFLDDGSLSIIFDGAGASGPGAVVYKKAGDRRLQIQFSRGGTGWRKL